MLENPSYSIRTREHIRLVKVVVFGSSGSGKTTLIRYIDPSSHTIGTRNGSLMSTVAFDLGIVNRGPYKLYVYGTPGDERFKVAMKVVSVGMHFGLIVVDSTKDMTPLDFNILKELKEKRIPHIVLANKIDAPDASIVRVCAEVGADCTVMPISAKTGSGVCELMDLIASMLERFDREAMSAML